MGSRGGIPCGDQEAKQLEDLGVSKTDPNISLGSFNSGLKVLKISLSCAYCPQFATINPLLYFADFNRGFVQILSETRKSNYFITPCQYLR